MEDERLVKRVAEAEVSGPRVRGRPRLGWMDGVKRALDGRGMSVLDGKVYAQDRTAWRRVVSS